MFGNFYTGKRVLVTGHSGFKGGWLALWLNHLGASVWGLGLQPPTSPNFYELIRDRIFEGEINCDIRQAKPLLEAIQRINPDLIFHLAAQALVGRSYAEPLETLETNVLGTAYLLDSIRQLGLSCALVVVTSDKCYENRQWDFGYREIDPLGGHDVYSMSKAAAELVAQSWRRAFFLPNTRLGNLATARAGNVIGGGDYAQDRLVPDCIRALLANQPIPVRNPLATRPWQHVLDCLSGYLWLGARLAQTDKNSPLASGFNFGPGPQANRSVAELVQEILSLWPGQWLDASNAQAPHEAKSLNLTIDKAASLLQWTPNWDLREAIHHTIAWYKKRHVEGYSDMTKYSRGQIDAYCSSAHAKHLIWA